MNQSAPRSIEHYLRDLRAALHGADPALVQDALYDAEEYLRAEVASHPDKTEADVLELISSTYGAPAEVAAAYRNTEATVAAALAPPRRAAAAGALGRFFGVYADSRAWTSLFYALLALPVGIFYFTVAVTGLSMSAGFAVLVIGIPFFLLFIGFTRILALAEGRMVEGLLGVRMPRRPRAPPSESTLFGRIKAMLTDPRTWTTVLYMLVMLPLGICYFTGTVVLTAVAGAFILAPIGVLAGLPIMVFDAPGIGTYDLSVAGSIGLAIAGILLLTLFLHLIRAIGAFHGQIAKRLLVSRESV